MNINNITEESVYSDLSIMVSLCSEYISKEGKEIIIHYLTHDEVEIAFEAFFLELIEAKKIPPSLDINKWYDIGRQLHIDKESVLDADFWSKFLMFIDKTEK